MEAITNKDGKGGDNRGNHRRSFRRRRHKRHEKSDRSAHSNQTEKPTPPVHERPKWTAPVVTKDPLPVPVCPICSRPIQDITAALTENSSGKAVHFDCIINQVSEGESLEKGDFISYIGGGRFGIVHNNNPGSQKKFIIKKIIEWENKDDRPQWRSAVSDRYSVT